MHLRNHENFSKMKQKNFTLGALSGEVVSEGFCRGVYVRGFFFLEPTPGAEKIGKDHTRACNCDVAGTRCKVSIYVDPTLPFTALTDRSLWLF